MKQQTQFVNELNKKKNHKRNEKVFIFNKKQKKM